MPIMKVIELVGRSSESWDKAVSAALAEASKSLRNIESLEITNLSASVEDDKIGEWRADVRVSFRIEEQLREQHHEHHEHHEYHGREEKTRI